MRMVNDVWGDGRVEGDVVGSDERRVLGREEK